MFRGEIILNLQSKATERKGDARSFPVFFDVFPFNREASCSLLMTANIFYTTVLIIAEYN